MSAPDKEIVGLVRELWLALSPLEREETRESMRHWIRDPMGCIDHLDMHGPYSRAFLILQSMGILEDKLLALEVDE